MAVTLPIALFLIDYLTDRKRDKTAIIDKIPFFILSIVFGIIALFGQYSTGAIRNEGVFNLFNKVAIASYSAIFYLNKILMPIRLSCLYPRTESHLTFGFLILPLVYIILIITLSFFGTNRKRIIFGNAFFLINILPVLQLTPIGETIVADRYVYIPSIGIFYLMGEGFVWLYTKRTKYMRLMKIFLSAILICIISILTLLTWKRCRVWKDSLTLWNDVLDKYPNAIMAYHNRGVTFLERKEYTKAISDFNHVINFVSDYDRRTIYLYLATLYRAVGRNERAVASYKKAKEIDIKLVQHYYEIGNKYKDIGKYKEAIALYKKALGLDSNNLLICGELADTYIVMGNYKESITLYKKTLEIAPNLGVAHNNLAVAYYFEKQYDLAVKHCDKALNLGYKVTPKLLELLKPYRK
jgi:Tfp pilus assembly protein PilF